MKKFTYSLISIALATALTACGGGDKKSSSSTTSTNNHNNDTQQQTAIGRFVDSAVEGVEVFQNGKSLGKTLQMGQFEYKVKGGLLTFKIGQVTLGITQPKPIVTPVDLTTDVKEQTEIMQVLQSLDSDQNPENGITISDDVIKNLDTPMVLTKSNVTPLDVIQKAIPGSHHVVSADAARAHFAKTQEELNKQPDKDDNDQQPNTDIQLTGIWQSECHNHNDKPISYNRYLEVKKIDDQKYQAIKNHKQKFSTKDCEGEPLKIDQGTNFTFDKTAVTIIDNNTIVRENKEGKTTYHRIK